MNSFRATEPVYLERYFTEVSKETYRISDEIKAMVRFSYVNLLDSFRLRFFTPVDVIFCRNVLIYFDSTSKKRAIDNLYQILAPGGYLLLGHAESLINVSTAFIIRHLKHDLVYQKPEGNGG